MAGNKTGSVCSSELDSLPDTQTWMDAFTDVQQMLHKACHAPTDLPLSYHVSLHSLFWSKEVTDINKSGGSTIHHLYNTLQPRNCRKLSMTISRDYSASEHFGDEQYGHFQQINKHQIGICECELSEVFVNRYNFLADMSMKVWLCLQTNFAETDRHIWFKCASTNSTLYKRSHDHFFLHKR